MLFKVCVLYVIIVYTNAGPINTPSVYHTINGTLASKCPYLTSTSLMTPTPDFFKPCDSFERARTLKTVSMPTLSDALCVMYYNYIIYLCDVYVKSDESIGKKFINNDEIKRAVENGTVEKTCLTLKQTDFVPLNVQQAMTNILSRLKNESLCEHMCYDFSKKVSPVCSLSAYMADAAWQINKLVQNNKPTENNIRGPPELNLPATEDDKVKKQDTQSTQENVLPKTNAIEADKTQKPDIPKTSIDLPQNENKNSEDKDKVEVTSPPSAVQVPEKVDTTDNNIGKSTDSKTKPKELNSIENEPQKNVIPPIEVVEKKPVSEPKQEEEPSIQQPLPGPIENPSENEESAELDEENNAQSDTFDGDDIRMDPEEVTISREKPKANTKPYKTEKEVILPYKNPELDGEIADDSYFFSYFMMVCVVFILVYVGYHNKQKVLALVLEGRKGKRTPRARRPNSANYHKLDSNLEEAVTSPCNKNTTNIIY